MLPSIRRIAYAALRHFTSEARDEAVQEIIASTFAAYDADC